MTDGFSLIENCLFASLDEELLTAPFSCGDVELDDFFIHDAALYSHQLLGKSYCFVLDKEPLEIVCAFTVANDSIKAALIPSNSKNKVQRKIPNVKRMRSYPAVLIGRIGVSTAFQNKGYDIGKQTINYIKRWFIHPDNKTGCRFVVVDAYNASKPLHFYEKNDFQYLYATEHEEKAAFNIPESEELHSRMMYFDLMQIQE